MAPALIISVLIQINAGVVRKKDAYVITVVSYPATNVSCLVPFMFYPVVLMALSGTPYRPLLGRAAAALPFSLAGGISSLLLMRTTAFYIGSIAVSHGALSCASILLRTLLTVMAVLILIATTSLMEISEQLVRLRLPKLFCLVLIMTYRYISVLLNEAVSMHTAYTLRTGNQKGIKMRDMGGFLGQLLLRSTDRAEQVYYAMKCRGFHGRYPGKTKSAPVIEDALYTGALIAIMLFLRFFDLSQWRGKVHSSSFACWRAGCIRRQYCA